MHKNIKYWLALNRIEKLGPVAIKKLFDHFGSIEQVWNAGAKEVLSIEGMRRDAKDSFIKCRGRINLDEEIDKLKGVNALCLEDEEYPSCLRNIYDPPPVIYLRGTLLRSDQQALAMVGTRQASHYGRATAEKLAGELAQRGFTVVSGLALGIDAAAHQGAIKAGGRTLAVLGSAVDNIYPRSNLSLAKEIEKRGAVISEFPLGSKPEVGNFPRRNRIIAGLSLGVIVVEGARDSGAMITANFALEQGREVFAVPGNIGAGASQGPHSLIKQGAKLVEGVEDVLEELHMVMPRQTQSSKLKVQNEGKDYSSLSSEEQKIVSVLSLEPKHLDIISVETKLSIPQVSSALMMLEIKKAVRQLPGKNFVLS